MPMFFFYQNPSKSGASAISQPSASIHWIRNFATSISCELVFKINNAWKNDKRWTTQLQKKGLTFATKCPLARNSN